jgi:hypothetical protein
MVSPNRGDGKTSTTLSMARQVARRGQRALVSMPIRASAPCRVNTRFGGDGLIAVLEGSALLAEAVQANDILGCDMLGTCRHRHRSRRDPDVAAIFADDRGRARTTTSCCSTPPPLNAVSDALPFAVRPTARPAPVALEPPSAADIDAALDMLAQVEADALWRRGDAGPSRRSCARVRATALIQAGLRPGRPCGTPRPGGRHQRGCACCGPVRSLSEN